MASSIRLSWGSSLEPNRSARLPEGACPAPALTRAPRRRSTDPVEQLARGVQLQGACEHHDRLQPRRALRALGYDARIDILDDTFKELERVVR